MSLPSVAVTGLGLMTGLGLDLEHSWKGLLAGLSPIQPFDLFDAADLACPYGVQLPEGADDLFKGRIKKRRRSQMTRGTMMTVVTAQMAMEDAAIDLEAADKTRIGVVVGATGTGYTWQNQETDPQRILRVMPNAPAAWISLDKKLAGPSFVVSTACSSGTYALSMAHHLIVSGQCDVVIAGAGDSSVNYLDVEGFCSLMALSSEEEDIATASRPFDETRSGFVIGEGAGMLVLESPDFARKRGARVYGEMPAPALTSETYNIVSPEPGGAGMARTLQLALDLAGLTAGSIDYVNAHGTSTTLNDIYETGAVKRVFGDRAKDVPVSSTKSMTGHCLGAAAGVEAVIACKALEQDMIPPTANLHHPDPDCDLDYVPNAPRAARLNRVMSNSFAFGGHNGVCIFAKPGQNEA
ncbi:MAG: beta-ketoacyl-[acyl-carrier-protein] synthase family protein [bacterium]|nr:beta-ketoacyl-[acyl-carrier-protein] synthase family protein [bacterium]